MELSQPAPCALPLRGHGLRKRVRPGRAQLQPAFRAPGPPLRGRRGDLYGRGRQRLPLPGGGGADPAPHGHGSDALPRVGPHPLHLHARRADAPCRALRARCALAPRAALRIVYVYTQLDAGSSIAVLRREGEKKRRQKSIRTRLAPTARKRKRSHGPRAAFDPGSGGTPRRSGDVKAASPRQADADDPSINVVYTQYTIHIHNPARRPAPGFFAPRRRRENVVYTHKKAYNPPLPPRSLAGGAVLMQFRPGPRGNPAELRQRARRAETPLRAPRLEAG